MRRLVSLLVAAGLGLLAAPTADAWSINTHVFSADRIIEDLADDGAIDVFEVRKNEEGVWSKEQLGTIPVDPVLVNAILSWPAEFRAGSCSADGYPDMYVGQSIIHPYVPGQRWSANDWARHVVREARKLDPETEAGGKALAFAAGWLVHYAGDGFGHTWVNGYAGGAWDWGEMPIVLRHVAVEAYLNSRLPGVADGTWKIELDMDPAFVRDALMLSEDVRDSLVTAGYIRALVDYHETFRRAERKCEREMEKWWNGVSWAIGPVEAWLEHQRRAASRALYDWAETSNRAMRYLAAGNPVMLPFLVTEWMGNHLLQLLTGIPRSVLDVIDWLGAPVDWIMDPVADGFRSGAKWIWEHLLQETFAKIVNAEEFVREVYGEEIFPVLHEEWGLTDEHPFVDWEFFAPLHDTVVLGKLALLDPAGLEELGRLLGVEIPASGEDDNILWDCIESLDASHQFRLPPTFRLLESEELEEKAFRRLFKTIPWEPAPSAVDPAHLLVYAGLARRQVCFALPLPDPGAAGRVLRGYVYEDAAGAGGQTRVPIFETPVPTSGRTGVMTGVVKGRWNAPAEGLYRFHLAVAAPQDGQAEPAEDEGVDVIVRVDSDAAPFRPELPGRLDVRGGPTGNEALEAMRETAEGMREMLADPEAVPGPLRAELEGALRDLEAEIARMERLAAGEEPGPGDPLADPIVPFRFPEGRLRQILQTETDDLPPEMVEQMAEVRMAVGRVEDAGGRPVPDATVTLIRADLLPGLRDGESRPVVVPFDGFTASDYQMGYTDGDGWYGLPGCPNGRYAVIVSAPGLSRKTALLAVNEPDRFAFALPDLVLGNTVEDAGPGGAGEAAPGGQHAAEPGFGFTAVTPFLVADDLDLEDGAEALFRLRARGAFAGAVDLEVGNLPQGLTAEFPVNPVPLAGTVEARVRFTAKGRLPRRVRAVVRASGGGVVHEAPVFLYFRQGELRLQPDRVVLNPGQERIVRFSIAGSAAEVRLAGPPPAGLSVEADTIQAHPHAKPLRLRELTVDQADSARRELLRTTPVPEAAGPAIPVPATARPERPPLTPELLARGPRDAPREGILLGPGGFVSVRIRAGADLAPGTWRIPVHALMGARRVEAEVVVEVRP